MYWSADKRFGGQFGGGVQATFADDTEAALVGGYRAKQGSYNLGVQLELHQEAVGFSIVATL